MKAKAFEIGAAVYCVAGKGGDDCPAIDKCKGEVVFWPSIGRDGRDEICYFRRGRVPKYCPGVPAEVIVRPKGSK